MSRRGKTTSAQTIASENDRREDDQVIGLLRLQIAVLTARDAWTGPSDSIADARQKEPPDSERRHDDPQADRTVFAGGDTRRTTQHLHVLKQLGERLIEAEIRDGPTDLPVLDQKRPVSGETGMRDDARVESTDIPEAARTARHASPT